MEYEAHMAALGRQTLREALRLAVFVALLALGLIGIFGWTGGAQ
jgi:hypothetical protein